jgi:hypothetical protein
LPQKALLENKLRELRELAEAEGLLDSEETQKPAASPKKNLYYA